MLFSRCALRLLKFCATLPNDWPFDNFRMVGQKCDKSNDFRNREIAQMAPDRPPAGKIETLFSSNYRPPDVKENGMSQYRDQSKFPGPPKSPDEIRISELYLLSYFFSRAGFSVHACNRARSSKPGAENPSG